VTRRPRRETSRIRLGFKTRIALCFAGLIVVVNLVVLAIQRGPIVRALERDFRIRGRELAVNLAERAAALVPRRQPVALQHLVESFLEFEGTGGAAVFTSDGNAFAGDVPATAVPTPVPGGVTVVEDGAGAAFSTMVPGSDAVAQVRLDRRALEGAVAGIGLTVASIAAAAIGVGFLLVFVAASVFTRPVELMAGLADRIRRGELGARLDLDRTDELGRLAAAMDAMSTRLQEDHHELQAAKAAAEAKNELLERQARRLESQTRNLETLVASVAEAVVFLDPNRRVAIANRAAEALLGAAGSRIVDRPLAELRFPETDVRLRAMLEDAFARVERGERHHSETCVGSHLYTVTSVHQAGGRPLGVLAVVRDLSQIRALESEQEQLLDQLYQQEKMAIVGLLAASLAHDLNTPLGTILLHTQRLAQEQADGEERAILETVRHQVHRCREIVRRLLGFSRLADGRPVSLDLEEVIDRSIGLVQAGLRQKGIFIRKLLAPNTPRVRADANQMEQVLINLIWNGADAMPDGGRIDIDSRRENGRVEIRVRDEGKGIPEEIATRVFDPFFTTKPPGQGTGLGLAICRRIMEEHDGTITVSSGPDGGTEVLLRVPAASSDDD